MIWPVPVEPWPRPLGLLLAAGCASRLCGDHTCLVFVGGDAEAHIMQAGVKQIWSTDSISHSTACIHLDKRLASAIKEIL